MRGASTGCRHGVPAYQYVFFSIELATRRVFLHRPNLSAVLGQYLSTTTMSGHTEAVTSAYHPHDETRRKRQCLICDVGRVAITKS